MEKKKKRIAVFFFGFSSFLDDDMHLEFYRNRLTISVDGGHESVTVDELHGLFSKDADLLERCHCYMQWLFPIDETSSQPPLTPSDARGIATGMGSSLRYMYSIFMMLRFYGMTIRDMNVPRITVQDHDRFHIFLVSSRHNWRRVSRILRSMALVGLRRVAVALLAALEEQVYTTKTLWCARDAYTGYWVKAIEVPPGIWPHRNLLPIETCRLTHFVATSTECHAALYALRRFLKTETTTRADTHAILGMASTKHYFYMVPAKARVRIVRLKTMKMSTVPIRKLKGLRTSVRSGEDAADREYAGLVARDWDNFDGRLSRSGARLYASIRASSVSGGRILRTVFCSVA